MLQDNVSTKIHAEFKPSKSGVFTLGSLIVALVLILIGVWYIADEKYIAGFLLFMPGLFAGAASYVLGFKTNKNQDLDSGFPIHISARKDSYELSADPRTNEDLLLRVIAASADVMRNRKPLPEANGMVSADGSGDASRKDEANQIIKKNNLALEDEYMQLENVFTQKQKIEKEVVDQAPRMKFVNESEKDS